MRWTLGLVGLAVAGIGAWQGDDLAATVADLNGRVAAIEERLETRPVRTVEAKGVLIEGVGDAVSEPIPLVAGTTLFTLTTDGTGRTAVDLLAAPGEEGVASYRSIDARDGSGTGTTAAPLPATGSYVVAVTSDGAWSVVVEQ